jgi:hypothetical protein
MIFSRGSYARDTYPFTGLHAGRNAAVVIRRLRATDLWGFVARAILTLIVGELIRACLPCLYLIRHSQRRAEMARDRMIRSSLVS